MNQQTESLFGPSGESAPPPLGPSLGDQITGLVTRPGGLFDDLRRAPSWVGAYLVAAISMAALTLTWAFRIDWLTFIADQAAKAGKPAQEIPESAVGIIRGIASLQMLAVSFGGLLFFGLLLWGLARWWSEDPQPASFGHAMAALAVPSLAKLPAVVLGLFSLATRPLEHTPEWYLPTNMGFYIHPESPKVQALLHHLDPFGLAFGVLGWMAMRRVLRLPTWACAVIVVLYNGLFTLWPILAAK